MIAIGANAVILNSRANLDAYVGGVVSQLLSALRAAQNAQALISQLADADLTALGYTDGTNGTPNTLGYLKSAVADANDLASVANGATFDRPANYNYVQSFRYAATTG